MADRNLLAVSITHTEYRWKFGMPCVLWGRRTSDDEPRCFTGYTQFPVDAELYALGDFEKAGYHIGMKLDEPVKITLNFCKMWKNYDTVLVTYDDYIAYCKSACLPITRGY